MNNKLFFDNYMQSLLSLIIVSIVAIFSGTSICHAKKNSSGKIYVDSSDFAPIEMKERLYRITGKKWSEFTSSEKQQYLSQWKAYQKNKRKKALKKKKTAVKNARKKDRIERREARRERNKIKKKQRAARKKARAKARKKKAFRKKIKNQKKKMKRIRKKMNRRRR